MGGSRRGGGGGGLWSGLQVKQYSRSYVTFKWFEKFSLNLSTSLLCNPC